MIGQERIRIYTVSISKLSIERERERERESTYAYLQYTQIHAVHVNFYASTVSTCPCCNTCRTSIGKIGSTQNTTKQNETKHNKTKHPNTMPISHAEHPFEQYLLPGFPETTITCSLWLDSTTQVFAAASVLHASHCIAPETGAFFEQCWCLIEPGISVCWMEGWWSFHHGTYLIRCWFWKGPWAANLGNVLIQK